jgi:hypothetical protein
LTQHGENAARSVSPAVVALAAAAFLITSALRPPEIHSVSRAALGLLAPVAVLACVAAWDAARARFASAAPVLAVCAAFLAANGWLGLQPHGSIVAAERIAMAGAAFFVFRELTRGAGGGPDAGRLPPRSVGLLLLALIGCASALVALWQKAHGLEAIASAVRGSDLPFREEMLARVDSGRVFGTVLLPGSLAGLLSLSLPATVSLALGAAARRTSRALIIAMACVQVAALILTGSVAGMAALALAAAATAWTTAARRRIRLAVTAAVCLAGAALLAGTIASRGFDWRALSDPAHPAGQRLGNWMAAGRMLAERPILGGGGGAYAALYPLYRREGMNESRHAHNSYLEMAVEYGPLALPVILVLAMAVMGRWRAACRGSPGMAIACAGLPAFLLHNLVDFTAYQPGVLIPCAALAGIAWDAGARGPGRQDRTATAGAMESGSRGPAASRLRVAGILACAAAAAFLAAHAVADGLGGILAERADDQLGRGDVESGIASLRLAGRLCPANPAPPGTLAAVLVARGRPAEALEYARRARALDPCSARAEYLLGSALLRTGEFTRAYVHLARASDLYPLDEGYRKVSEEMERKLTGMRNGSGR